MVSLRKCLVELAALGHAEKIFGSGHAACSFQPRDGAEG